MEKVAYFFVRVVSGVSVHTAWRQSQGESQDMYEQADCIRCDRLVAWSECDVFVLGTVSWNAADDRRVCSFVPQRMQRMEKNIWAFVCSFGSYDWICFFPCG